MTGGTEGSSFQISANRYREILARQGVTLKVLPSQGSLENLKRLSDPKLQVDIGFVQGGLSALGDSTRLVSLGSVFYVPVWAFYRAPKRIPGLGGDAAQGERNRGRRTIEVARSGGQGCGGRPAKGRCRRDLPHGRLGDAGDDARDAPLQRRSNFRLRAGRRLRASVPLPHQDRSA